MSKSISVQMRPHLPAEEALLQTFLSGEHEANSRRLPGVRHGWTELIGLTTFYSYTWQNLQATIAYSR